MAQFAGSKFPFVPVMANIAAVDRPEQEPFGVIGTPTGADTGQCCHVGLGHTV